MAGVPVIAGVYSPGPFPAIPRTSGTAAFTVGTGPHPAPSPTAHGNVTFQDKVTYEATLTAAGILDLADPVTVIYSAGARTLYASTGTAPLTEAGLRKAAIAVTNKAKALKLTTLTVTAVPTSTAVTTDKAVEVIVHAVQLTNYHFARYITDASKAPTTLTAVHLVEAAPSAAAALALVVAVTNGTVFARDLANERADEMSPARLEAIALSIAALDARFTVHTLTGTALIAEGMHLMHAVGQAAREQARYVELRWNNDTEHGDDVIAVVGKGITFDSGGLNIKQTGFMEDMHMDMGGSAAALGSALTTYLLNIPRNVVFVAAIAENCVDSLSYKPHNIIRSHKGLTVEIGNTDAEGRLVLADALSYVQKRHSPHTVFDLATLTGACVIALGEYAAGVFTNSSVLQADLVAAGAARVERLWPLPLLAEHKEELTGTPFADLKSTGEGRYGGACTAAAFLSNFIGGAAPASPGGPAPPTPAWVHIDIAGPGMFSRDRGFNKKGGTGFGVAAVVEYLRTAPAGPRPLDP